MGRKRKREEDYIAISNPSHPESYIHLKRETFFRVSGVIAEMREGDRDVNAKSLAKEAHIQSAVAEAILGHFGELQKKFTERENQEGGSGGGLER
jgi:hypothetical protein